MAIFLLLIFSLIEIFLLVSLIKCLKNTLKWSKLFIFELLSIFSSVICMIYFDNLPGGSFMPGLAYIGEIVMSFLATLVYTYILINTIIIKLIIHFKSKK